MLLHSGQVLAVGGVANGGFSRAQLYDPATGTWSFTGRQIAQRDFPGANLLKNGDVLMTGGLQFFDHPTATNYIYRTPTAAWATTGMLNTPRWLHTATLLPNGQVLIAGGAGQQQQIASAELGTPSP